MYGPSSRASFATILRQSQESPAPSPSSSGSSNKPPLSPSVTIIIVILGVTVFILIIIVLIVRLILFHRRSRLLSQAHLPPQTHTPHHDRLAFAYLPSPSPALVRQHRAAAELQGLTSQELQHIAPTQIHAPPPDSPPVDDVCPVCLEQMTPGAKVRRLSCTHMFHTTCINEWAIKANRCPVCNTHIFEESALQTYRSPPPPPTTEQNPTRHRRRRTRGENGTFQLRSLTQAPPAEANGVNNDAASILNPSVPDPSVPDPSVPDAAATAAPL